jgi:hypothetical protein
MEQAASLERVGSAQCRDKRLARPCPAALFLLSISIPENTFFIQANPRQFVSTKCCHDKAKTDQLNTHNENPQHTDHLFGSNACNIQGASYLRQLFRAGWSAGVISECLALDRAGIAS